MLRRLSLLVAFGLTLAACAPAPSSYDTQGGTQVYRISAREAGEIPIRMLDSVNSLRQASGAAPLQLNSQLNASAATHSRDMSVQNRPWHFGSDGSSPLDRARRAGYSGKFLGENISETYETELETLAAWMQESATRDVILNPEARELGISWFQEESGKIWWTLVTGAPQAQPSFSAQPTYTAPSAPGQITVSSF
ncbi:MAG: CAP domain-containing protein [Celeribacter sp.]|jgi:uncharacterized protein YkwD